MNRRCCCTFCTCGPGSQSVAVAIYYGCTLEAPLLEHGNTVCSVSSNQVAPHVETAAVTFGSLLYRQWSRCRAMFTPAGFSSGSETAASAGSPFWLQTSDEDEDKLALVDARRWWSNAIRGSRTVVVARNLLVLQGSPVPSHTCEHYSSVPFLVA